MYNGTSLRKDNDTSDQFIQTVRKYNNPTWTIAGKYISEVYVLYKSGVALLSRRFERAQVSSDPQLVGGFLSALSEFIKSTLSDHSCGILGQHELLDIGISCSRWIIKHYGDFTVAVLIQNDSPLIQRGLWHVIDEFAQRVCISFDIFYQYVSSVSQTSILITEDYSKDFGNTIDLLLFETLSEFTDENVTFYKKTPTLDAELKGDFQLENKEALNK